MISIFRCQTHCWLAAVILFLSVTAARGQYPSGCASVGSRANSNGQATSCPNVSATPYASNFVGTSYATVPVTSKTGNLQLNYTGSNPSLTPYAITRVWATSSGTSTLQVVAFGPASPPTVSGGNTQVSYCFYTNNLPTAGTLTLEFTNPQTGVISGICSFDATCNSNCSVVANPPTLPVIYANFTATAQPNNTVQLKWTTAQEQNNKGFSIERSAADSSYTTIGFVPSANPNGMSSNPTHYSYTDGNLPSTKSISYRLRQEDLDGKYAYSEVRVVQIATPSTISIYSDGNNINVTFPPANTQKEYDILVYDTQGRVVRRHHILVATNYTIPGLTHGNLYYVSVKATGDSDKALKAVYMP